MELYQGALENYQDENIVIPALLSSPSVINHGFLLNNELFIVSLNKIIDLITKGKGPMIKSIALQTLALIFSEHTQISLPFFMPVNQIIFHFCPNIPAVFSKYFHNSFIFLNHMASLLIILFKFSPVEIRLMIAQTMIHFLFFSISSRECLTDRQFKFLLFILMNQLYLNCREFLLREISKNQQLHAFFAEYINQNQEILSRINPQNLQNEEEEIGE